MAANPPSSPGPVSSEEQGILQRLREAFGQMPDTRQSGKVLHRLDEVLVCAFCSILCDGDSFTDMEDFAQTQLPWLRGFMPLEHGAPSHDVFRNVFMMLQPESMLELFGRWCGPLEGQHVAIDGKTLRGTHDTESGRHRVHLLRAWVDERSLSAGQALCAEKSNEIEAIPRQLAALELRGATVTIDAIGTQAAIAEQIHEAGADYVLALKANQKNALAAVQAAFGDAVQEEVQPGQPPLASSPVPGARHHESLELSHGRCERREYQLLGNLESFAKSWKWAGLQAVGKVRREVQRGREGPPLLEEHYFLCSFKDDIKRFAALVRGHWSVENRCHWVLDVTFGEDHCQVRDRTAAHNFSLMRELAIKVLREHPGKLSLRRKRRRAALDPDFRLHLLGLLHA
ncbi:MAG: ISAs1 family transposase [Verrucomicrobiota bacterium]